MNEKREQLKRVYPGKKWIDRVNKMSDEQVVAVYYRFKTIGKVA